MQRFSVSARGLPAVHVEGGNWIVALGEGLSQLERDDDLQRLACEVLPNGTVIARDIRSGTGYIVTPTDADEPPEPEPLSPEDLQEMRSLIDEIRGSESRREACQLALEIAQELVPAEAGAVMLAEGEFFRFVAVAGPKADALVGGRLPLETGMAGVCYKQGRVIVVGDAGDDPRHCAEVDDFTGYETREMLVVPVAHEGKRYGVLELLNLPKGERFHRVYKQNAVAVGRALGERISRF